MVSMTKYLSPEGQVYAERDKEFLVAIEALERLKLRWQEYEAYPAYMAARSGYEDRLDYAQQLAYQAIDEAFAPVLDRPIFVALNQAVNAGWDECNSAQDFEDQLTLVRSARIILGRLID